MLKRLEISHEYGTARIEWMSEEPKELRLSAMGYTMIMDNQEIESLHLFLCEVLAAQEEVDKETKEQRLRARIDAKLTEVTMQYVKPGYINSNDYLEEEKKL